MSMLPQHDLTHQAEIAKRVRYAITEAGRKALREGSENAFHRAGTEKLPEALTNGR